MAGPAPKAQRAISTVLAKLLAAQERLLALRKTLPEPADEGGEAGAGADERTELLGVIDCVLRDHLEPAIESLRGAASPPALRG
jgi:hypothetical protein